MTGSRAFQVLKVTGWVQQINRLRDEMEVLRITVTTAESFDSLSYAALALCGDIQDLGCFHPAAED